MGADSVSSRKTRRDKAGEWAVVFMPLWIAIVGGEALATWKIGPAYFLDYVLLGAFLVQIFFNREPIGSLRAVVFSSIGVSLLIIVLVATANLVASGPTEVALRDYHPFLVLAYAILVSWKLKTTSREQISFGVRSILVALTVKLLLIWVGLADENLQLSQLAVIPPVHQSGPGNDGLFLAVLATVAIFNQGEYCPGRQWRCSTIGLLSLATLSYLGSRAAILAFIISIVFLATIRIREMLKKRVRLPIKRILYWSLAVSMALLAPMTIPTNANRLAELNSINAPGWSLPPSIERDSILVADGAERPSTELHSSREIFQGSTTVSARLNSWLALSLYQIEDPSRLLLGNGLGSNYLQISGARDLLLGYIPGQEGINRYPHNQFLSVAAALGLPVALLFFFCIIRASFMLTKTKHSSYSVVPLVFLVSVTVTSSFGVIFENPWGSIPLAWSIGFAVHRHLENSTQQPLP